MGIHSHASSNVNVEDWPQDEDFRFLLEWKVKNSPYAVVTLHIFYDVCFVVSIIFKFVELDFK